MKAKNKIPLNRSLTLPAIQSRLNEALPPRRHEVGSSQIMIIDGMNIAYQAKHAYAKLSFMGKSTALVFGIPSIIKGLIREKNPSKVIVAWDGKRSKERIELLPEYKSHRDEGKDPKEKEMFYQQLHKVRKLLYYLGIAQAHNEDVEGDDMLYMLTQYYQKLSRVLIVSGDKDFNQLINHDVSIYNPRTKVPQDTFAFIADTGVELPQFVDYLCLIGDKSDDIPGYRGCGEATAKKFLRKYWSIKKYLKSDDDFPGLTDKEKLAEIYKRNKMLIDLKKFFKKHLSYEQMTFYRDSKDPMFNDEKFTAFCNKYGLKSFKLPDFKNTFKNL